MLVGSLASARVLRNDNTNIVLSGMPPMGVMDEMNAVWWTTLLDLERFNHQAGERPRSAGGPGAWSWLW